MEPNHLQLTPEQRRALAAHSGEPVHIRDDQTKKVYLLIEQGACPQLDEEYIRSGLEVARGQIARGETSQATVDEVIAKAKLRQTTSS